jgi:hypothetical protein
MAKVERFPSSKLRDTQKSVVTGAEMFRKLLDEGVAGDNVGCLLRGIDKDAVERGQVMCKPGSVNHASRRRGCMAARGARWPEVKIALHQGARVIHDSRRTQGPKSANPMQSKAETGAPSPDGGTSIRPAWSAAR